MTKLPLKIKKTLIYFFCFFLFFFIIFRRHSTTSFQRVVELSRFSKLATYKFDSVRVLSKFNELTQLKIESRVSFPDHRSVSFVVEEIKLGSFWWMTRRLKLAELTMDQWERFEGVYRSNFSNSGEVFAHVPKDEVEIWIEKMQQETTICLEKLKEEKESILAQMAELKKILYGKFKDSINQED